MIPHSTRWLYGYRDGHAIACLVGNEKLQHLVIAVAAYLCACLIQPYVRFPFSALIRRWSTHSNCSLWSRHFCIDLLRWYLLDIFPGRDKLAQRRMNSRYGFLWIPKFCCCRRLPWVARDGDGIALEGMPHLTIVVRMHAIVLLGIERFSRGYSLSDSRWAVVIDWRYGG